MTGDKVFASRPGEGVIFQIFYRYREGRGYFYMQAIPSEQMKKVFRFFFRTEGSMFPRLVKLSFPNGNIKDLINEAERFLEKNGFR